MKFTAAATAAKGAGLGVALTIRSYNCQAISALGFVSQLCWAPDTVVSLESKVIRGLLKVPYNTFSAAAMLLLNDLGVSQQCRSVFALNFASLVRVGTSETTHMQTAKHAFATL